MKKTTKCNEKDEALTSIVGEMLIIALVLILIAVFTVSAFNLLPGDRDSTVIVAMNHTSESVYFWHKGGDWIYGKDLTASLTPTLGGNKIILEETISKPLTDCYGNSVSVFDLGGRYCVSLIGVPVGSYSLRLTTGDSVIYAKDDLVIS